MIKWRRKKDETGEKHLEYDMDILKLSEDCLKDEENLLEMYYNFLENG